MSYAANRRRTRLSRNRNESGSSFAHALRKGTKNRSWRDPFIRRSGHTGRGCAFGCQMVSDAFRFRYHRERSACCPDQRSNLSPSVLIELLESGATMIYRDRIEAGKYVAAELVHYANRDDVLVLALPRGGVPVAFEVAT